jgi:hypothetical protein
MGANSIYSGAMDQKDKDEILESFLKQTGQALGRLGCNLLVNYGNADAFTWTNTSFADTPGMSAQVTGSGGVVVIACKVSGSIATVSAYAKLMVDGVSVDEARMGSAGGTTNGTLWLFHVITDNAAHAVKVQSMVDSGTFTGYSRKFYIIEILRG